MSGSTTTSPPAVRNWINLVEGTQGHIYGDEGLAKRMPEAKTHVFKTKDGRVIHMHNSGSEVVAAVDGEQAGYLDLRNDAPRDKTTSEVLGSDWFVHRAWVEEPFRGQGVATAMYDYAYYAGFRPLKRSKSQTDGGKGVWTKRGARTTWKLQESVGPIVAYHGSSNGEIEDLDDLEMYFAASPQEAKSYCRVGNPVLYSAEITMQNPLRTEDYDLFAEAIHQIPELKAQGYDGIVFGQDEQFCVFNAHQSVNNLKLALNESVDDLPMLAKKLKADGLRDIKLVKDRWLVHFSGYNEEISREGFTKGTALSHDGWKGAWGRDGRGPGINFAVDIDDDNALEFWAWQSPCAVVFKVPAGVTCWHKDGFDQVLFWGPSVMRPIIAIDMVAESTSAPEEEDWRITHINGSPEAGEPTTFYDLLGQIKRGLF